MQGQSGYGLFAPAKYTKQFHRRYVSEDELNKRAKDARFPTWTHAFIGSESGPARGVAVGDAVADQPASVRTLAQFVQHVGG